MYYFCSQVTKEELAKLVQGFEKQDILTSSGVTLAGNRYIYLSGTDRVVRAKLGKVGVHCMKTTQGEFYKFHVDLWSVVVNERRPRFFAHGRRQEFSSVYLNSALVEHGRSCILKIFPKCRVLVYLGR